MLVDIGYHKQPQITQVRKLVGEWMRALKVKWRKLQRLHQEQGKTNLIQGVLRKRTRAVIHRVIKVHHWSFRKKRKSYFIPGIISCTQDVVLLVSELSSSSKEKQILINGTRRKVPINWTYPINPVYWKWNSVKLSIIGSYFLLLSGSSIHGLVGRKLFDDILPISTLLCQGLQLKCLFSFTNLP